MNCTGLSMVCVVIGVYLWALLGDWALERPHPEEVEL